jgi:hypothetical protein
MEYINKYYSKIKKFCPTKGKSVRFLLSILMTELKISDKLAEFLLKIPIIKTYFKSTTNLKDFVNKLKNLSDEQKELIETNIDFQNLDYTNLLNFMKKHFLEEIFG